LPEFGAGLQLSWLTGEQPGALAQMYGYYDLFLINPDGYCFYPVAKESDYQTNLINGQYADTGLAPMLHKKDGKRLANPYGC